MGFLPANFLGELEHPKAPAVREEMLDFSDQRMVDLVDLLDERFRAAARAPRAIQPRGLGGVAGDIGE